MGFGYLPRCGLGLRGGLALVGQGLRQGQCPGGVESSLFTAEMQKSVRC